MSGTTSRTIRSRTTRSRPNTSASRRPSPATSTRRAHILVEQGIGSQGHHRETQEGPGGLCEAGDGKIEGYGLQARGRRSGVVRSERDGAGIWRRRDASWRRASSPEEPVKTQYGYHVILLEDSRPIEAPPLDQVKPQLTQQLQQQSLKKQLDAPQGRREDRGCRRRSPPPTPPQAPAAK